MRIRARKCAHRVEVRDNMFTLMIFFFYMIDIVELLDLPDEIILTIMKKVDPQVLLLCSMINIGNSRLEQLVFDRCHSIDLTFDYSRAPHKWLMKRFYSSVLPRINDDIQSLTIDVYHISFINKSLQNSSMELLPNLKHLKIMLGTKYPKTGIPCTIGNFIINSIFRNYLRT